MTLWSDVVLSAGARARWRDNEFKVKTRAATGPGTQKSDTDLAWVDPLAGVAARHPLTDR